jgi:hypothetical protein
MVAWTFLLAFLAISWGGVAWYLSNQLEFSANKWFTRSGSVALFAWGVRLILVTLGYFEASLPVGSIFLSVIFTWGIMGHLITLLGQYTQKHVDRDRRYDD